MKASLIVTQLNGAIAPHLVMGEGTYHFMTGETELFRVTAEGQPGKLASRLQEMMKEEAGRRNIALD